MPRAKQKEAQLREFLTHMDALAERLTPKRRPQDRDEPECSPQELRVLTALGKRGAMMMSDVADILNVGLSTATHTVGKLVAKGLVERKRAKSDRRIVQVAFSKHGNRINRFVVKSRLTAGHSLLEALSPAERESLIKNLEKMTQ